MWKKWNRARWIPSSATAEQWTTKQLKTPETGPNLARDAINHDHEQDDIADVVIVAVNVGGVVPIGVSKFWPLTSHFRTLRRQARVLSLPSHHKALLNSHPNFGVIILRQSCHHFRLECLTAFLALPTVSCEKERDALGRWLLAVEFTGCCC